MFIEHYVFEIKVGCFAEFSRIEKIVARCFVERERRKRERRDCEGQFYLVGAGKKLFRSMINYIRLHHDYRCDKFVTFDMWLYIRVLYIYIYIRVMSFEMVSDI